MSFTRREFGLMTLGAAAARSLRAAGSFGGPVGVEVGIISYSFRQISYRPEDVVKGMKFLGLSVLELEQAFFEEALGAPHDPTGGGRPALAGSEVAGGPFGHAPARRATPEQLRGAPVNEEDPAVKAVRAD